MILNVRVVPKSSRNLVHREGEIWRVSLTKPAHDGLANEQLVELLSEYFHIKKYMITIIKGEKSRNKVVRIDDDE